MIWCGRGYVILVVGADDLPLEFTRDIWSARDVVMVAWQLALDSLNWSLWGTMVWKRHCNGSRRC